MTDEATKKTRTLRELIPLLESDWLLPAWLLLAIIAAFAAETWTFTDAMLSRRGSWIGLPIGFVIASTQAIGSMMWSRATQHNARRYVKRVRRGPKDNRELVEDLKNSEPPLNVVGPAASSIVAGTISFVGALALYSLDGITLLEFAAAIAAPGGSIGAALLNGLYVYGESELARWREERGRPRAATGRTQKTTDRPQPATGRTQKTTGQPREATGRPQAATGRPPEATAPDAAATSEALAGHLAELKVKIATRIQSGEADSAGFNRIDVERLLNLSTSHAKNVIRYGRGLGLLVEPSRHTYTFVETP